MKIYIVHKPFYEATSDPIVQVFLNEESAKRFIESENDLEAQITEKEAN